MGRLERSADTVWASGGPGGNVWTGYPKNSVSAIDFPEISLRTRLRSNTYLLGGPSRHFVRVREPICRDFSTNHVTDHPAEHPLPEESCLFCSYDHSS